MTYSLSSLFRREGLFIERAARNQVVAREFVNNVVNIVIDLQQKILSDFLTLNEESQENFRVFTLSYFSIAEKEVNKEFDPSNLRRFKQLYRDQIGFQAEIAGESVKSVAKYRKRLLEALKEDFIEIIGKVLEIKATFSGAANRTEIDEIEAYVEGFLILSDEIDEVYLASDQKWIEEIEALTDWTHALVEPDTKNRMD